MKNELDFIEDKSIYYIGKDTNGNLVNIKELHAILLDAAIEIDRICRKNDIPYALGFGSALGIYNYGGFIPWDDDIDIIIPYEYIQKFADACAIDLNKDKYIYECYENNSMYNVIIPTGKFRIKNTYLKEKNWFTLPNRCGGGQTVFIDICTFINVPADEKEHKKLINYTLHKMPFYVFGDAFLRLKQKGFKKKIKDFERRTHDKYKDSNNVSQTVIIPWQVYSESQNKMSYPKEVIFPFKEYEFEGHKLYSFNNIKEFCVLRYGEQCLKVFENGRWIDKYPLEKRQIKHIKEFNLNKK